MPRPKAPDTEVTYSDVRVARGTYYREDRVFEPSLRRDPSADDTLVRRAQHKDGRTLTCRRRCGRCTARDATGAQCVHQGCDDYTLCRYHLLERRHLVVAPSRWLHSQGIEGRGLYAADPATMWAHGYEHPNGPPAEDKTLVVFRKDQPIDEFGGEMLDADQVKARYGAGPRSSAPYLYALGSPNLFGDDLCVGRAVAHVNDPRRADDNKKTYRESKKKNANARSVIPAGRQFPQLVATRDIHHGEEILFSYGWKYWDAPEPKRKRPRE